MHRVTYSDGKVIEERNAVGTNWIIKDAEGVKIGEEPLTAEELARFQAEGQPTADEIRIADIEAATDLDSLKAALVKGLGG